MNTVAPKVEVVNETAVFMMLKSSNSANLHRLSLPVKGAILD